MENAMEDPQKIKNTTGIWSNSPNSGNVSKENKILNSKRALLPS